MDDYSPLCEDCGYDLAGLHETGSCPECGRAIARSMPAARPGTAWQRRPGLFSWVRTFLAVLLKPSRTFRDVRIRGYERGLLLVNLCLAGAAIVAPWWGVLAGDPARTARQQSGAGAMAIQVGVAVAELLLAAACLYILTWIECVGIRLVARRRGWRLTHAGAWQVCAHASFGWICCGVLATLFLAALFSVLRLFGVAPGGTLDLAPTLPIRLDWYQVIGVGGPALAYFVGLIIFETLVYKGVNACKFAATIKPE